MPLASAADRKAVSALYAARRWPEELHKTLVVWFGLRRIPFALEHPQLWTFCGLNSADWTPPREQYLNGLAAKGIPRPADWQEVWRRAPPAALFETQDSILIAPGAGSRSKCWPLERFVNVARWVAQQGGDPVFLLGPAEVERGYKVQNFKHISPPDLASLQAAIMGARVILGNDAGPMHLAGAWGRPAISIFGPSARQQWAPVTATALASSRSCRPCTRDGRIDCRYPHCLEDISCEMVTAQLHSYLP
ncbi:MAG: glycosyltransferase family 9 protein [Thermodesulfobacteriota bacterium]